MRNNRYGGRGRGRGGGGHRGGRGGRGGRRSRQQRSYPTQSAESGNQRERIAIESGSMVLIDQFMLANPQFASRLLNLLDGDPGLKNTLVQEYGGCVVELEPGTYRIDRDPFAYSIVVHPEGYRPDSARITADATENKGHVFVDTRCLAMVDRELLDDSTLLQKYQELWFSGQDKACRDLLRDNGGAVRYGFQRYGDELGVFCVPHKNVICLWPDIPGAIHASGNDAPISQPA